MIEQEKEELALTESIKALDKIFDAYERMWFTEADLEAKRKDILDGVSDAHKVLVPLFNSLERFKEPNIIKPKEIRVPITSLLKLLVKIREWRAISKPLRTTLDRVINIVGPTASNAVDKFYDILKTSDINELAELEVIIWSAIDNISVVPPKEAYGLLGIKEEGQENAG